MIRGTTPTITYKFPFEVSTIEKVRIYFMQGNVTLLTKDEDDITTEGNQISVTLTEEETYAFSPKKRIDTQVRFLTTDGTVGASKPKYIDVDNIGGAEEILVTAEETEDATENTENTEE